MSIPKQKDRNVNNRKTGVGSAHPGFGRAAVDQLLRHCGRRDVYVHGCISPARHCRPRLAGGGRSGGGLPALEDRHFQSRQARLRRSL